VVAKRSYVVGLVALLVCANACSSSGGKQSAPTTTRALTATTLGGVTGDPGGGTGLLDVAANLGACPKHLPGNEQLEPNIAAAHGLAQKMVPIAAVRVRICDFRFSSDLPLLAGSFLGRTAARLLEDTANGLPRVSPGVAVAPGPGDANAVLHFVTFASDSQEVTLSDVDNGIVSNGTLFARPTTTWGLELLGHVATGPTGGA
jgi:hypothetical protein